MSMNRELAQLVSSDIVNDLPNMTVGYLTSKREELRNGIRSTKDVIKREQMAEVSLCISRELVKRVKVSRPDTSEADSTHRASRDMARRANTEKYVSRQLDGEKLRFDGLDVNEKERYLAHHKSPHDHSVTSFGMAKGMIDK